MQRLSKVVGVIAGLVLLGGCGSKPQATSTAAEPLATPSIAAHIGPGAATLVRYELTGTAITVDGTYAEPVGGTEKMIELRGATLPWDKNFILPPDQLFVAGLLAQGPNLESSITCRIIMNGNVVAQQTGSTVDCRAEVSRPKKE